MLVAALVTVLHTAARIIHNSHVSTISYPHQGPREIVCFSRLIQHFYVCIIVFLHGFQSQITCQTLVRRSHLQ